MSYLKSVYETNKIHHRNLCSKYKQTEFSNAQRINAPSSFCSRNTKNGSIYLTHQCIEVGLHKGRLKGAW